MAKKILDYGCGKAGNCPWLSKRGQYYGLDILSENISYAKNRYPTGIFELSGGNTIPWPDAYFDEIHTYDVMEHVDDIVAVLREISRVLKPCGLLYIGVPAKISEDALLKIRPDYWQEIGHQRVVDLPMLQLSLPSNKYDLIKQQKRRGVEALTLAVLFYLRSGQRVVAHQTGSPQFSRWTIAFMWLFDVQLFQTKLKYFPFIYIITLPLGWLVSQIFPKARYFVFKKK
ncbi:MAG: Methyltransferase type 11 [Candidatus Magasanikbacteria bacterium GW2011_GWA2_40_10]|uniref:Methyltransferase type 11 n=1 Tax=Candidatus Magasanikbacteria bacterium GW2011_GWA2_40_10 TaxID=1619037 RepID=A0A0G0Q2D4_9BACT|nr:MAG: Methyltransferase type 11 [Candidatus Magasanikbacteria bacterium GW2011_GWA2_40_10]